MVAVPALISVLWRASRMALTFFAPMSQASPLVGPCRCWQFLSWSGWLAFLALESLGLATDFRDGRRGAYRVFGSGVEDSTIASVSQRHRVPRLMKLGAIFDQCEVGPKIVFRE